MIQNSRIPTPGFQGRNSGIFQNSCYSYPRIPGEEFWNNPEFQNSYSRIPGEEFWNIPQYSKMIECLNGHWSSDACLVIWEAGLRQASFHNENSFFVVYQSGLSLVIRLDIIWKFKAIQYFFESFRNCVYSNIFE